MKNVITALLAAAAAATPVFISSMPPQYQALAVAAIALGGAVYHLYQDPPRK